MSVPSRQDQPRSGRGDPCRMPAPRLSLRSDGARFMHGRDGEPAQPDSVSARVCELSRHILDAPSPLEALEAWCDYSFPAERITFARNGRMTIRYPDDVLEALQPRPHEWVEARNATIVRGGCVLSEADEWFVPERVPPYVRIALRASSLPFSVVVRGLRPERQITAARLAAAAPTGATPVLEHRVVYFDARRRALAVTLERYNGALLGYAGPE